MKRREHWEKVYETRATDQVGWFAPHLATSVHWIGDLGLRPEDPIIDVGGGASTLVDDLLDAGHTALTVLDISESALDSARQRLGGRALAVQWRVADITAARLNPESYRLWHDRAVFHFLVEADDRRRYLEALESALRSNGTVILGTFSPEAPAVCSGLPVQRYSLDALVETLGPGFQLERHQTELHVTPGGVEQRYLYGQFRRVGRPT